MKSHLVITLRMGVRAPAVPHWADAVADKAGVAEGLEPAVDAVLARWRLPVWVNREYGSAGPAWSAAEIASGLDRVYRLVLQRDGRIPDALLEDLRLVPVVERARRGEVRGAPLPAPVSRALSGVPDTASREAIGLPEAHRRTRGDPAVTIAVIDTGVWSSHPELRDVLLPGFDFVDIVDGHDEFVGDFLGADPDPEDEVGHGTHVCGIVAARGRAMPPGVAPRCRVLPVRALGALRQGSIRVGAGLVDNINNAIKYAVDHPSRPVVINVSLGIPHTGGGLPHEEVVDYARRRGVTIVAAAGNDGRDALYYPGALPHVIAVGACDAEGRIAPFSTYGDQVSFVAPGEDVYSAYLADDYAFSSGTSQAAPFVTGAVALLQAYARQRAGLRLRDGQVKHLLQHTADRVDAHFKDRRAGYGRVNLPDALRLLDHRLGAHAAREGGTPWARAILS